MGESVAQASNIRVIPGDGIKLLSVLPNNYLDAVLITFPDPWPNANQVTWRVVQKTVLREIKRVLKQNGRVFIATDSQIFDEWTRRIFSEESVVDDVIFWEEVFPCPDRTEWLPVLSYYEQKGMNEGRSTMLQCWKSAES